ncbi:hypothetical protein BMS3Abin03_00080 [bacterium BMS3Abin03]|nr:hypothetical protein BMS3Abin03_00080 [bacterium BMS3Abin03]
MTNKIDNKDEEPAPFFGSWKKIYAFVFGELIFLIILFYIFTKVFE